MLYIDYYVSGYTHFPPSSGYSGPNPARSGLHENLYFAVTCTGTERKCSYNISAMMVFSLKMLSQKHCVYFACVWCKSVHTPSLNIETSTSLRSFGDIICGDFCQTFYLEIKNSVIILTSPLSCHVRNKLPGRFVNRRE